MVMFTKAEVVRKFSKMHGVPDEEAKVFFEIFLNKASEKLEQAEAVYLEDFGYFQLRKGKIKNLSYSFGPDEPEEYYIDLILYRSKNEEKKGGLIFNIPDTEDDPHFIIDSHFSLSIGKPVIPLAGVKSSDFFVPPSGYELRRILDSKAEKILEDNEIISIAGENELISIDNDSYRISQFEMDYDSSKMNDELSAPEVENIPWNFGDDLSRQIEEDSILDIDINEDDYSKNYIEQNNPDLENKSKQSTDDKNSSSEISYTEENNNEVEIKEDEKPSKKTKEISSAKDGKSSNLFWLTIGLIVLAGAGYFLYKKVLIKNDPIKPVKNELVSKPVTVQRSFEIPVIYPYITREKNIEIFDPFALEGKEQINKETNHTELKLNPRAVRKKIKNNIYKYDDIYVVQLSSWKSKSIAEAEVEKYNNSGFNAFLESIKVENRGVWHRVRVGNFSTLDEAEKFLNQK